MTICAAVKRDGKVFVGADSLVVAGGDTKSYTTKITKLGYNIILYSGLALVKNILDEMVDNKQYKNLNINSVAEARDFGKTVFSSLKAELEDSPWGPHYTEMSKDIGDLLICTPTKIFQVDPAFNCAEIHNFIAIGSGAPYATAVLEFGLRNEYEDLKELLHEAIDITSKYSLGCSLPAEILEVGSKPIKVSRKQKRIHIK